MPLTERALTPLLQLFNYFFQLLTTTKKGEGYRALWGTINCNKKYNSGKKEGLPLP